MNRIRKWRVWYVDSETNPTESVMGYFDPIHDSHHVSDEAADQAGAWFFQILNDPDCTMMDFTGLRDADGKDIYEGDILRVADLELSSIYVAVVEWDESSAMFVALYNEICDAFSDLHARGVRVIGNIYANQNLLRTHDEY